MNVFKNLASRLAMVGLALASQQALAQEGTGKTVRIVVPYAAGGPADLIARLLAEQIGRVQGPTMVIENRTGASGVIGTESVSRAAPDGNTLVIVNNGFVINPILRPSVTYNPLTSFEPICLLANLPGLLVVNSSSSFRSLADFLTSARAHPGELTFASFGPATPNHLAEEALKRAAKVDWTYVPYPGGDAPGVTALLGGHITVLLATYSGVMEQLKSGTLRALVVAEPLRLASLPDVPTIAESGYPSGEFSGWLGLLAPARTSKEVVARLSAIFLSALNTPEMTSKLQLQGIYPAGTCGAGFSAYIHRQLDEYTRIIHDANIKVE